MTDRELLELVLAKVTSVDGRLTSVEQNMATKEDLSGVDQKIDRLDQRLISVEDGLTSVDQRLTSVEDRMTSMESSMTSVDGRLTSVEQNMATKEDIARLETKIDAVAVIGQKDVIGVLQHIAQKTEIIPRLEAKLDILNNRQFEQEVDINLLKRAK